MGPCTMLLLVTGLFLVGWTSYVNSASIQGHCPPGHFPCHLDCCIEEVHFCSDTQQRCRKCEIFQEECEKQKPQAKVHPHCFLFCHQYRLATNTTSVPPSSTAAYSPEDDNQDRIVPVLTPEILTAIVVSCVLLFSCFVIVCFCHNRWVRLTESSPMWLRAVLGLFNKKCCRPEALSREGVAVVYHNGPKSTEESNRDESGVTSPMMPKCHNDNGGQIAEDFVEDEALQSSLQKRSSNGTLDSNEGHPPSEAKEVCQADNEQSAVEKDAPQQRQVSSGNSPASSISSHGQGDTTSLSSASPSSGGEGAGHSSESLPSSAASCGRAGNGSQGRHQEVKRRAADSARRSNDHNNEGRRANAGDPPNSSGGSFCHRDGNMTQSNQTYINIYPPQAARRDVDVSRPSSGSHSVHNGEALGSSSSKGPGPFHQGSGSQPNNPSGSASHSGDDQSPQRHDSLLYTNPTNPPHSDQGQLAEVATGVESSTLHYVHLPNPNA